MQTQTFYDFSIESKEQRIIFGVELFGAPASWDKILTITKDEKKKETEFFTQRKEIKEILPEKTVEEFVTFLIKEVAESNLIKIEELNGQLTLIEIFPPDVLGVPAMKSLIFDLEDHYGIDISDAEWGMIERGNVESLCNFIERKLQEKANS